MRSRLIPAFLFFAPLAAHSATLHEADLCIYDGTSAGVVAAVQAAKMRKSVVLVEPGQHLGGMSVEGLGGTDIDKFTFMVAAQSAATAAVIAKEGGVELGEIFYPSLRDRLLADGQVLTVP